MNRMPDFVNLATAIENGAALRVEISRGFRAPVRNGSVAIEGLWRADINVLPAVTHGRRKPQFIGTFVTDSTQEQTPADLFRQLADIYEAGEVKVLT